MPEPIKYRELQYGSHLPTYNIFSHPVTSAKHVSNQIRDGVQLLVTALFSPKTLAVSRTAPAPTTQLLLAKPLPKPKPLTKWEKFTRTKGIQSRRRDRKVRAKRARRGSRAGDGRAGIRPRTRSGCAKSPSMPVCLLHISPPSLLFFRKGGW